MSDFQRGFDKCRELSVGICKDQADRARTSSASVRALICEERIEALNASDYVENYLKASWVDSLVEMISNSDEIRREKMKPKDSELTDDCNEKGCIENDLIGLRMEVRRLEALVRDWQRVAAVKDEMIDTLRGNLSNLRCMALEEAAGVCDRHANSSWNDDRRTQARLDAKEIRALKSLEELLKGE